MVMQPPSLPVPGKVEVRKYDPKQALATRKKPGNLIFHTSLN